MLLEDCYCRSGILITTVKNVYDSHLNSAQDKCVEERRGQACRGKPRVCLEELLGG